MSLKYHVIFSFLSHQFYQLFLTIDNQITLISLFVTTCYDQDIMIASTEETRITKDDGSLKTAQLDAVVGAGTVFSSGSLPPV